MQRTVATSMSIGAQMIATGTLRQRGIIGPTEVPLEPFLAELRTRGLNLSQKIETWDGHVEPGGE